MKISSWSWAEKDDLLPSQNINIVERVDSLILRGIKNKFLNIFIRIPIF